MHEDFRPACTPQPGPSERLRRGAVDRYRDPHEPSELAGRAGGVGLPGIRAMLSIAARFHPLASTLARAAVGAACVLLPWTGQAEEPLEAKPKFSDREIEIVLTHG